MTNPKDKIRQSWGHYTKDMNFFLVRDLVFKKRSTKKPKRHKTIGKIYRYLHEFCELSTFHGFKQLAARRRHWIEYLLWTSAMLAALAMTLFVSQFSWNRYNYFPTVIVIEKNNQDWSVVFPSATICPELALNQTKLKRATGHFNVTDPAGFIAFFNALSNNSFVSYNNLPEYYEIEPDMFLRIVIWATDVLDYNISSTLTLETEYLLQVFTELGVCYSYNSKIAPFFNPLAFVGNVSMADQTADLHTVTANDDDSFASISFGRDPLMPIMPYKISVSGPYELPSLGTPLLYNFNASFKEIEVACLAIISTDEVRELSVEQRNCRTRSDGSLRVSKIYSYNLCRMECRMDLAFKSCGCVPYMYVTLGSPVENDKIPICDVKGMKCLAKLGRRLSDLRDPITRKREPCDCHVLCTDFNFRVLSESDYPWGEKRVKWQMANFPRSRFKRTIIFGFSDMIVGIGSTAGLFMGCSVLSFVEIIYFFTLRLAFIIYKRTVKTSKANLRKTKKITVFELSN